MLKPATARHAGISENTRLYRPATLIQPIYPYICCSLTLQIFMKVPLFLLIFLWVGCSPASKFKKDRSLFNQSVVIKSFKSVNDLNDAYFDIRENNFFEYYRQLFDSIKNSRYTGRYQKSGDTFLLEFYDKKGIDILGRKALIDSNLNQIFFFK